MQLFQTGDINAVKCAKQQMNVKNLCVALVYTSLYSKHSLFSRKKKEFVWKRNMYEEVTTMIDCVCVALYFPEELTFRKREVFCFLTFIIKNKMVGVRIIETITKYMSLNRGSCDPGW